MGKAHAGATQVVTANSSLRGVSAAGLSDRGEIETLENATIAVWFPAPERDNRPHRQTR